MNLLLALVNSYSLLLLAYLALRLLRGDAWWWLALLHTFALYLFAPLLLSLPLALLLRGWRTALLAALLLLTGAGWFLVPLLRPAPPVTATGPRLDIITFNLLGTPRSLQPEMAWLLAAAPDVILLQEAVAEGDDPRLAPLAAAYPFTARVRGSLRLFSRYPLREVSYPVLEDHPGRIGLRAVLDVAGQPVVLYGVHLSLPRRQQPRVRLPVDRFPLSYLVRYDESRRNAQIQRLLMLIQRETAPVIVAGDFNLSATSIAHDRLSAVLVDAWTAAGAGFGHTYPVSRVIGLPGVVPPLLRIDYVWHSRTVQTVQATRGPALGSDHRPVVVTLALPER
ncbi:MAG: endonuclease/exonuclease/phosphatase family protein [Anaerolineae bacterium]|nr:endonuclease/exonuclease/phosphatase family protein [Anaerolineae bacterium]